MVKSIVIMCDQSPIGKNTAAESLRFASGLISLSDLEMKVVFIDDAVYFFNKNINPKAVNRDDFTTIMRIAKLSDLDIYLLDQSLKERGLEESDLISYENLKIIGLKEIAQFINNADTSIRF